VKFACFRQTNETNTPKALFPFLNDIVCTLVPFAIEFQSRSIQIIEVVIDMILESEDRVQVIPAHADQNEYL
jgi:hypothetical protein